MTTTRKVAIVTGAGSGIGKAVALALAGEGYAVVLAGRRAEALEQTVRDGGDNGSRLLAVPTDVTDPGVGAGALRPHEGRRSAGSTSCSTTPASGAPGVPLDELTVEQWRTVVDTNLTGPFLCTQQAFRLMKDADAAGRAGSSTTARFRPLCRGRSRRRTRPPSTRSPA